MSLVGPKPAVFFLPASAVTHKKTCFSILIHRGLRFLRVLLISMKEVSYFVFLSLDEESVSRPRNIEADCQQFYGEPPRCA